MKITIHYMGQVRHAAGVSSQEMDLPGPCSVRDGLRLLIEGGPSETQSRLRHFLLDEACRLQRTILLFAGQEQIRDADNVMLHDGDVLTVLSPIAGG